MSAPKGNRNNPAGRPPKNKALSDMLEASLGKGFDVEGKKIPGKKILSDLVSNAIINGKVRFPNDTSDSVISIQDWIGLVKWVYERIDGKPKQPIEGSGENGEIIIVTVAGTINDDSED